MHQKTLTVYDDEGGVRNFTAADVAELQQERNDLRAELTKARRLIDEARTTFVGIAGATARAWELPRNEFIDEFLPWAQSRARDSAKKLRAILSATDSEVKNG